MGERKTFKPQTRLTFKVHLAGGQQRLTEAILYVSERCRDAPRFGLTKLNKTIWRADFNAFAVRKVPVTGRAYQKLPHGPAPVEMRPLLRELEQNGTIEIDRIDLGNEMVEQRVFAIMPANGRFFSQSDLEFLNEAIDHYWNKTGTEASEDSHDIGWRTRDVGDEMPYELAFLSDQELEPTPLDKFVEMGRARGWTSA